MRSKEPAAQARVRLGGDEFPLIFYRPRLSMSSSTVGAMAKLVRAGHEPGLLAYDDDVPVGWISIAPREEYTAILRSPQYRPREGGGGTSVVRSRP